MYLRFLSDYALDGIARESFSHSHHIYTLTRQILNYFMQIFIFRASSNTHSHLTKLESEMKWKYKFVLLYIVLCRAPRLLHSNCEISKMNWESAGKSLVDELTKSLLRGLSMTIENKEDSRIS